MRANRFPLPMLALAACVASTPAWAHHSTAAEYDEKKPVTVKGTVSDWEWTNPHVYFLLDVADPQGQIARWVVEFPSKPELRRDGWNEDSLKVGELVTVAGIEARDGGKRVYGKTVTVVGGKKLSASANAVHAASSHNQPAPRWPDGHVRLGAVPGEIGYWADPSAPSLVDSLAGKVRMNAEGLLANLSDAGKVAPFQPWARGLYEYRQRNLLKDDPMASCLPPGGPREFQVPHGLQILEQPERHRLFVLSGGGNRNWRLIYTDGRPLPNVENETPTYFGFSVGKWEGDTLVIQSIGFNERFWFSNGGLPHTENLDLTERLSRPDFNTLKYEVTVNDPGAYTRPWSSGWTLRWVPNQEIEEYFCDDNNIDAGR